MSDAPRDAKASDAGGKSRSARPWNDSAWLWGALFALAALAAVLAIAPRHVERQARIVRMHEARQRAAAERAGALPAPTTAPLEATRAESSSAATARTRLDGLLGFLALAVLVALAGLGWTLTRKQRAAAPPAGKP